MLTKIKIICVSLCVVNLSACVTSEHRDYSESQSYGNQVSPLYPEGYDNTVVYGNNPYEAQQEMMVPDTYNLKPTQSPVASKDLDRRWVSSQSPTGYTIQIANDEKAAHVAGALQKAPKNERMAEVKYQQNGKVYYKGLYGSYPTPEAASKALNALPDDVKQNAGIQTWESVQQSVTE